MTRRSAEPAAAPGTPVVLRRLRPRRLLLRLEPTTSAAALARRLVDRACAEWGLPALRDPARLVVTELVSNAVRHARTPLAVCVSRGDDAVDIHVGDRSPTVPRPRAPVEPTVEGGRGLHVVAVISDAWGITRTPTGKVVWARLAV
jgi:anti-sigma regulatory factor (Ser/Thr protein kinase)